ncbi:DUF397 domain-containing protein [Streptomyces sp. NPDC096205]|uniref:DUF397 domain-containing protein n=1 Tax=Streptomyces sp. NPDC096205 TaxID=3366081 RepID=UPI0037F5F88B
MPIGPPPESGLAWFKSSYSGGNATECVEAALIPHGIAIRDSKQPTKSQLAISTPAWTAFLAEIGHSRRHP